MFFSIGTYNLRGEISYARYRGGCANLGKKISNAHGTCKAVRSNFLGGGGAFAQRNDMSSKAEGHVPFPPPPLDN